MENKTSRGKGGGVGFVGVLTIIFVVLKLTGNISWSWLWVLSPVWISIVLVLGITIIVTFLAKKHDEKMYGKGKKNG